MMTIHEQISNLLRREFGDRYKEYTNDVASEIVKIMAPIDAPAETYEIGYRDGYNDAQDIR